jgi:protein-S-isoprenylcysteine O-methyltransferase Ste14
MNKTLEDRIGKLGMLLVFGYLCYQQVLSFIISVQLREEIALWPLALLSQVCGVVFLAFILYYTAIRLPPRDSAAGLMPRLAAVAGTFFVMLLLVLPPAPIGSTTRILSSVLMIVGTCMSIYCLIQLGRSFSMMAAARELKTTGSYALVRHPLYAAELVMIVGVVMSHGTLLACSVGTFWLLLQVRRIDYEESILRKTFPEYDTYAKRVPMLVPRLPLSLARPAVAKAEALSARQSA